MNFRNLLWIMTLHSIVCSMDNTRVRTTFEDFFLDNLLLESPLYAQTFKCWQETCSTLPYYTKTAGQIITYCPIELTDFQYMLNAFFRLMQSGPLSKPKYWIPQALTSTYIADFFDLTIFNFQPYVQKLIIPSGSKIALKGDLHGDIHSLLLYIESLQKMGYMDEINAFKIKDPRFYMIFLGDYTDKGMYGVEVLYTLMRLKLANPHKVYLVRGNHEDISLNVDDGFYQEFSRKFFGGITEQECDKSFLSCSKLYDFLPVALYLGCGDTPINFMLCCHGGLEIGYNPYKLITSAGDLKFQFITHLKRLSEFDKVRHYLPNQSCTNTIKDCLHDVYITDDTPAAHIGFMWSDFVVEQGQLLRTSFRGRNVYEYGQHPTQELLHQGSCSTHIIRGIFRGHQHNNVWDPMMELLLDRYNNQQQYKGLARLWQDSSHKDRTLWDGIVCTFLVSPDTKYGIPYDDYPGFNYDTFALLETADNFENWHLQVHRNILPS